MMVSVVCGCGKHTFLTDEGVKAYGKECEECKNLEESDKPEWLNIIGERLGLIWEIARRTNKKRKELMKE